MDEVDLRRALETAKRAITMVGTRLQQQFNADNAQTKTSAASVPVTPAVVDQLNKETELYLEPQLRGIGPNVGFVGQETGVRALSDLLWLVDPIDGTDLYTRGIPYCTTTAALVEKGVVVVSVIHDFIRNETYWATKGGGAFMNGTRIYVSNHSFEKSLISFDGDLDAGVNDQKFRTLRKTAIANTSQSNGYEFALLASGKLDAKIMQNPSGQDWDFAPGALLVSEAGGMIANIGSDKYDYTNHDFIAASPIVYEALAKGGGLFA
jgi:fructose-1,6-bisphosphatase/inositol monophosphatase family enzyme